MTLHDRIYLTQAWKHLPSNTDIWASILIWFYDIVQANHNADDREKMSFVVNPSDIIEYTILSLPWGIIGLVGKPISWGISPAWDKVLYRIVVSCLTPLMSHEDFEHYDSRHLKTIKYLQQYLVYISWIVYYLCYKWTDGGWYSWISK